MQPDAGDIRIGGRSLATVEPERRGIGMAFQNFALYPHMTAFENIASPLRAHRIGEDEIRRRVEEVAGLLRIGHVLSHQPRALSNGQKQRTALARSLVRGPAVLLLDDPLRNVDAKIRYEMRLELPRLLRGFQSTVIYVTQDYKEAMALGDRIGVLREGRFTQIAAPAALYRRPADIHVARLFGDPPINLIPTRPEAGQDGRLATRICGTALAMPDSHAGLAGRDCVVGIRPEDIMLEDQDRPGTIAVDLDTVTPLNIRQVMLLKAADDTELLSSCPEGLVPLAGRGHQRVWARVDLGRALWFDRASGALM
jgi:multiple sugar transport system ATP-binding protein